MEGSGSSSRRRKRGTETKRHTLLKQKAAKFLKAHGYKVSFEYPVIIRGRRYFVDVVGFKGDKSIAIECGNTSYRKLLDLKEVFSEVIHFSYGLLISQKIEMSLVLDETDESQHKGMPEIIGVRKVTNRGRVQIPKEIRDALGVEDGDRIIWVRHPDGRFYILKAKTR